MHNPNEPGDRNFNSFYIQIPLGHSTKVLISVKATEIDDSGKKLSETQRGCRLIGDTESLHFRFSMFTQE